MKRLSVAMCACALVISAAFATVSTVSATAQSAANKATEVGVTPTEIRIAVVADVDKSGFIKAATPLQDKIAADLGPHATKILEICRSIQ